MKDELDKLIGQKVCVVTKTNNYYIGIVTGKLTYELEEYLVANKRGNTRIKFTFGQVRDVAGSYIDVVYN